MNSLSNFCLSCFIVSTILVSLCTESSPFFWAILLLFQPLLIGAVAWIIGRTIPFEIKELAIHNSFRFDGSRSPRREERENRAIIRMQFFFAAFLVYVFWGFNWIYLIASNRLWLNAVSWPNAALAFCFWLVVCGIAIPFYYLRVLHDYQTGVDVRYREYVEFDDGVKSAKSNSKSESAA